MKAGEKSVSLRDVSEEGGLQAGQRRDAVAKGLVLGLTWTASAALYRDFPSPALPAISDGTVTVKLTSSLSHLRSPSAPTCSILLSH